MASVRKRVTFAQARKAVFAALVPFLPVAAYYLGVNPLPEISEGAVWYAWIVSEMTAFGVYQITNDPPGPPR